MIRIATIMVVLTLSCPAAAQITGAAPPATPTLKREATVASDVVRIGDLVDNAGASARVPIFRSPDLGHTGMVAAARVLDAARGHGLIVETKGISEIAVTRATRILTVKDIEARIAAALAGQSGVGAAKNLVVTIERDAGPIFLEPTVTGELQASRVLYDPRLGRFDVTFELPASATARRMSPRYVGSVIETVATATLGRSLGRGDVVRSSDIVIERRPKPEIDVDVVGSIDAAVGLAARRPLRAGQPVRAADLMKPELVRRNEAVTLVYEVPGIVLTVRGKAIESGAEGDTISVLNVQSKRTVQGTVSGPGRVTIAAAHVATQASAPIQSEPAGRPPRSE